jgi:hypothetical protein
MKQYWESGVWNTTCKVAVLLQPNMHFTDVSNSKQRQPLLILSALGTLAYVEWISTNLSRFVI